MKCAGCPLFTSWNNESDRGEACGLFGDGWDSPFQYEDKEGSIVGCYIDRHFIEKTDEKCQDHLFKAGDKIAQLVIMPYIAPDLELVEDLKETERGAGGFGSTGR